VSKPKSRQQRRAQERDRAERLHSRPQTSQRPLLLAAAGVVGVIAVIAALVIVKLTQGNSTAGPAKPSGRAPAAVVRSVATVPASLYNLIGYQSALAPLKHITGSPLRQNGKPLVVFEGAEFCPLCAAERWALVAAFSRFGTFHNLGATSSSTIDVDPETATFSFHKATYTSRYLALDTVEVATNQPQGNYYKLLEKPTALENRLSAKYDPNYIPFVYLGPHYIINTVSYNPAILAGMSMQQIAAAMRNPSSPICQAILGTANNVTAALCRQTNGAPASVCSSPGVMAAAKHLPT
jgi:Domain of unknown function (DUF929)